MYQIIIIKEGIKQAEKEIKRIIEKKCTKANVVNIHDKSDVIFYYQGYGDIAILEINTSCINDAKTKLTVSCNSPIYWMALLKKTTLSVYAIYPGNCESERKNIQPLEI